MNIRLTDSYPRHAIANTLIGVVFFFIFLASVFHFTGVWYAPYLPMSDSSTYDNTGASYNVSRILTDKFTLNEEAYKQYSPLFLRCADPTTYTPLRRLILHSTTFAMSYGLSFAAIASLIVYTYLHHGKHIWQQYKNSTNEAPDVHMKMMKKYKEAPSWWYFSLFGLVRSVGLSPRGFA